MSTDRELTKRDSVSPAVQNAVTLWADATTDATSRRRHDLLRDKSKAVGDFFSYTQKPPGEVTPLDVKTWQAALEEADLSPATIYARISRLSSFYEWLMTDPALGITFNPVTLARPRAPKAYQTESTKSLTDEEILALVSTVKARADVVGLRDYALLVFYLTTGWRRAEIINLKRGDVHANGGLLCTIKVKGGDITTRTVEERAVRDALVAYLDAAGRPFDNLEPGDPLWTAHDRSGRHTGKALTSHGFTANFKRYARLAGLGDVHLHQIRHTVARVMGEELGSVKAVQEILGHKNEATTRVYLQRVGVQRDLVSRRMADRLGL